MKSRSLYTLQVLLLVALVCCGSGRQLQSIAVTPNPATAPANNGTVQFTATGTLTDGTQVNSIPVLWSIGNPWTLPPIPCCIALSTTGLAQCQLAVQGGSGVSYQITATAPVDMSMPISKMTMFTKNVSASAQLGCE